MVFFLSSHIISNRPNLRFTDREGSIARLPGESRVLIRSLVRPFGRIGLNQLQHMGDRFVRLESSDEMDMVGHATDFQEYPSFATDDAPHVFVEFLLQRGHDQRLPEFCAEHNVIEQIREGAGHEDRLRTRRRPFGAGNELMQPEILGLTPQAT